MNVPDLEKAVAYYNKTLGFPEAFRNVDNKGRPTPVYVQISRNTFLELQPAGTDRPPGITHFGAVVENMGAATTMFNLRSANFLLDQERPVVLF